MAAALCHIGGTGRGCDSKCPHKLDTKEGEKGHTTHVKRWRGKVREGKLKTKQIMQCSVTQLAHVHRQAKAPAKVLPVGHSASIPQKRSQTTVNVKFGLPQACHGPLLHFMRTECDCDALPRALQQTRSIKISIGNEDGSSAAQFRLHAYEDHYEGPWFDFVECDILVDGHCQENMVAQCHHVGQLVIPQGNRKGQIQHFIYVDRILSDTARGVYGAVKRINNPAYPPPEGSKYTQEEDKAHRRLVARLLEDLGVRTVDMTQMKEGVYLTPSNCHGLALLQPGFFNVEDVDSPVQKQPDFWFQVNNTLLDLFK